MSAVTELEKENTTDTKGAGTALDVSQWVADRWLNLGTPPISDQAPAGTNVRLEDDFERIELELTKLESLTNEEPIEWGLMCDWCEDILKKQSKDLLVACYLTRALCDGGVITGLIAGLKISSDIVENHWDSCYPPKKRKKGRAAAFDWMVERCFPLFDKYSFSVGDISKLKALDEILNHLDTSLLAHLSDDAPSFAELQQGVRRQLGALEMEQKQSQRAHEKPSISPNKPSSAAPKTSAKPSTSASVATFSGAISNERDLLNCYRSNQDSLRSVCEYLRAENIANPDAYRINRFLTWLGISQLPPNTNGVTQMRPPPKERLQHYQSLIGNSKTEDLVPEVETSISKSPYWLDGHRIVHESLMESNYSEAAQAVVEGVKDFVRKYPDVVSLKFSDQTGFADEETKRWINLEVLTESGPSQQTNNSLPVATTENNEWEEAYQNAMTLVREKKLNEAFALFKDGCQRSYSKRSLAFWRFYQARFCFETQHFDLAISLLELIDKTLRKDGVESWEPDVSAKVIELLLRSYKKQPDERIPKERVAALNERLCQFDLATAYELSTN